MIIKAAKSIYDLASEQDMSLTDALKLAGISHRAHDGLGRQLFKTSTGETIGHFSAKSAWEMLATISADEKAGA